MLQNESLFICLKIGQRKECPQLLMLRTYNWQNAWKSGMRPPFLAKIHLVKEISYGWKKVGSFKLPHLSWKWPCSCTAARGLCDPPVFLFSDSLPLGPGSHPPPNSSSALKKGREKKDERKKLDVRIWKSKKTHLSSEAQQISCLEFKTNKLGQRID